MSLHTRMRSLRAPNWIVLIAAAVVVAAAPQTQPSTLPSDDMVALAQKA